MHIASHRTCGSRPPCTRHPIHACAPVCCVVVVSLHPSPFPLRSVALLPALPDVFLRVPREVEVQIPVRLPLGDRRPRDTPHTSLEGDPEVQVSVSFPFAHEDLAGGRYRSTAPSRASEPLSSVTKVPHVTEASLAWRDVVPKDTADLGPSNDTYYQAGDRRRS